MCPISRSFRPVDVEEVRGIAEEKGLKPSVVKGTTILQFTKGRSDRVTVVSWDEFESLLEEKQLQVYEYHGWMKIFGRE